MAEPRGTYIKRANFSGNYGSHFFLDIRYDHWENTEGNYSTVRVYAYIGSSDGYSANGSSTPVYVEGNYVGSITSIGVNSYTEIGYIERRVGHDGAGNASFTTNASCSTPWKNVGSASVNNDKEPVVLPNIPQYAGITSFVVYQRDETSVEVNYNVDSSIDYCQYSINDTGWHDNGVSIDQRSFVISGLSPNTAYNFRIRVKRTESQLWTESSLFQQRTYDYPNITSVSGNRINSAFTVVVSNPVGRTYTLDLISVDDGSYIGGYTGNLNGGVIGFDDPNSLDLRYKSIPNKPTGTFYARLTYGSVVRQSGNATFTILGTEKPTVTTTAVDSGKVLPTGNITTDLTGSNKKIIKFISDVTVSVSATGQKYATIGSYSTKYKDNQQPGSSYTFSNVENTTFTGTAIDTRELPNSANATGLTLVDYIKLTLEKIELYRDNQTSSTLKCKGEGNYFSGNFGSLNNSLVFQLRYKASDSSTWSNWETKQMTIGTNAYSFDFTVGNSFDYTKTYNFEFKVADKCMTVTDSEIAKAGIPVQGLFENFIENFGVVTFSKGTNEIIINGDIKISGSNKYLKNL